MVSNVENVSMECIDSFIKIDESTQFGFGQSRIQEDVFQTPSKQGWRRNWVKLFMNSFITSVQGFRMILIAS